MNKVLRKFVWVLGFIIFALSACDKGDISYTPPQYDDIAKAKYVFFFIGDGMALPQIHATQIYLSGRHGITPSKGLAELNITKMPVAGFTTTYSKTSYITDSAASATALATGFKTSANVVSMDESGTRKILTMAQKAKESGMKVGILSSVSIDHATPAAFYAHQPDRDMYYEIAVDLVNSGFDYFAGGGFRNPSGYDENDGDIFTLASKAGYLIVSNRNDFLKLNRKSGKVIAIDQYLDNGAAMPYEIDRPRDSVPLKDYVTKGIELLDNPDGFFMMVEGGKIDWACHANDALTVFKDIIAFDEAVGMALEFYKRYPKDTLIVVTGDHETGGMTIGFNDTKYDTYFEALNGQTMSYQAFEDKIAEYIESKGGDNVNLADIYPLIEHAFGLKVIDNALYQSLYSAAMEGDMEAKNKLRNVLSPEDISRLEEALKYSAKGRSFWRNDGLCEKKYGGNEPVGAVLSRLLSNRAGIGWTTHYHTALPVTTFAQGVSAHIFSGYYDSAELARNIMLIMDLSE